jgi:hypothetical protein
MDKAGRTTQHRTGSLDGKHNCFNHDARSICNKVAPPSLAAVSRAGDRMSPRQSLQGILRRDDPGRVVYAPNYWQWFFHHRHHGRLPAELAGCQNHLDMLRVLGLDVFSRNVYCDQRRCWFGGLSSERFDSGNGVQTEAEQANGDLVIERTYRLRSGQLTERQRYVASESTLVQEKFLVDDYATQLPLFEQFVANRRWVFDRVRWNHWWDRVGESGLPIAGELFSPLKLLHLAVGPVNTTYLLTDEPERAKALLSFHEAAQLDLVRQMAEAGVPAMMAMDNLDSVFHTPEYVERFSAAFYEKAAALCHQHGSTFFIHACGRQKANLKRIASYGVDGLEGVASAPLGDVELDEAFAITGDRFILTGGVSAMEIERLPSRQAVFDYVGGLFARLRPYRHRFVFASSCNTAITTSWETLVHFRDAWHALGGRSPR